MGKRASSTLSEDPPRFLSPWRILFLGVSLLAMGTFAFLRIPGLMVDNAKGDPLVNAFYCSVITLTTVGYGDICPGDLTLLGQVFLVCYGLFGLGMFGGPVMTLASSWTKHVPGGLPTVGTVAMSVGVGIFMQLEGLNEAEAMYASFITGTTIGYGDVTPSTDAGKIAVAFYAICAIPVVAGLMEPARVLLEGTWNCDVLPDDDFYQEA
ncbi:predicted protein [Phaeodactylum tricornutum CCAP 1055/1]|uniref:Potassium channel domain-containing protein n=2 Tax=Phaeodactylum tricornutum TaxID=2850 RepID=B7FT24_PHATC|nr:predicted protein [Phaeodactylum tricornutum CCAP 1055/1]EEC50899.1 predicted protein [Phaeodactylum tricornutum CCAP 1055/1]|eukprot:XP_002178085.1 predicted protein [Phaeodactylum tricornutum CCAP 1055/1]